MKKLAPEEKQRRAEARQQAKEAERERLAEAEQRQQALEIAERRNGQHFASEAHRQQAMDAFLAAFAVSANVLQSARKANISRTLVYAWKEHDPDFLPRYKQAEEDARDMLRAEMFRRAVQGWEEPAMAGGQLVYETELVLDDDGEPKLDSRGRPIYKRGKQVTIRKYSDTLLMALGKARLPEMKEDSKPQRVEVSGPGGAPVKHEDVTPEPERMGKILEILLETGALQLPSLGSLEGDTDGE